MEQLFLILRACALCASFAGLCRLFQRAGMDRYIAPACAAGSVIVTLMLCGMAGVLPMGWNALYLLGFVGLIDAHILRRQRIDWKLLAVLAAFLVWLIWRFYGCYISHSDDAAHWGVVARYLIEENAFPNGMASMIEFQSYPLGSAAFIYYVAHSLGNVEGLYMLAQHFLMGVCFLPMAAEIRSNKRYLLPLLPAVYVLLFLRINVVAIAGLQVDWLIAFMGYALIASVLHYRDHLKKAIIAALPLMLALVYVKSSGIFFSACGLAALLYVARRNGVGRGKCAAAAVGGAALLAGAYLLWTMYVKSAYPAGFDTKHAVSVTAYAAELMNKGAALAGTIIKKMLVLLVKPKTHQLVGGLIYLGVTGILALGCRLLPGQRKHLRRVIGWLAACSAIHFVWYAMLAFMYLFSMPIAEAVELASYDRYTSTSLTCMMMLAFGMLFAFFGREEVQLSRLVRRLYVCGVAAAVAVVALLIPHFDIAEKLMVSEDALAPVRVRLQAAREALDLPQNSNVLIFCDGSVPEERRPYYRTRRFARYELYTNHITLLSTDIGGEVEDFVEITWSEGARVLEDPIGYVAENIDAFDAFILVDCDAAFDAAVQDFLREYQGTVPVYRAY